jgi:SNF2 family DNA or RNA helicase
LLNDRTVPLTAKEVEQLYAAAEAAAANGDPVVNFTSNGETIAVPATAETLAALAALRDANLTPPSTLQPKKAGEAQVLLIQPNENALDIEANWTPRSAHDLAPPSCLRTPLKAHQEKGLRWLQEAWSHGRPGVLLADDMGLGKTLQALTFLAWLREGMRAGQIASGPLLIVAPTGLLENWREEHDRHLQPPGLGKILRAYGRELATHRSTAADGRPTISVDTLRTADCVLTTYETLRDYDQDFGQARFTAAVFDEAQKIKTPGIRLTDTAKAMNVEFRVAMTGTPVENRLADLWCIVDAVHPGYLGELKRFSARYERQADESDLRALKDQLDRSRGDRPPLMFRRLRWDHLPDLPRCNESIREEVMPSTQHAVYEATIEQARNAGTRGEMLSALSALRRISLHPERDSTGNDADIIRASARVILLFHILDDVHDRHERALIFLDDRVMQARLAGMIQRRYRLPTSPMIINGAVPGSARQARVNRFQSTTAGFDVMLLSPRAGGVGLTLTAANHAIHLERWWNPAVEDQCTGRVLRIGQSRQVTVHVVQSICPGRRSFDQNLHALLLRKRELVRDTLGSGEVSEAESLTLLRDTIS